MSNFEIDRTPNGKCVTIKGTPVFIEEGESVSDAFKRYKNRKQVKSKKDVAAVRKSKERHKKKEQKDWQY